VSDLDRLIEIMDRLRSPGGCPWDAEQTHQSLLPFAVEEVYEYIEAVDSGDRDHMREELGDVLLQVVFHARVASEHHDDPFDIQDVARACANKLVHRHPHVFADGDARTAAEVKERWEQIKVESTGRASVMDGIPVAMPALARAQKVVGRAEKNGLAGSAGGPAVGTGVTGDDAAARIGADLLAVVERAQREGIDAEAALRHTLRAYEASARANERSGDTQDSPK
jgi:XTP/dITP diphosphohydrolase